MNFIYLSAIIALLEPAGLKLTWPSTIGESYVVEFKRELDNTWQVGGIPIVATKTNTTLTWIVSKGFETNAFFRVMPPAPVTMELASLRIKWPSTIGKTYSVQVDGQEFRTVLATNNMSHTFFHLGGKYPLGNFSVHEEI